MIGNDIVDLALARKESNWQRNGFLDKIFTAKEQILIFNAKNSEIMVWNLWSRKEAVYKIYNRETGIRGFFPLELECFDIACTEGIMYGEVVVRNLRYFTKTIISTEVINTIAVKNSTAYDSITTCNGREFIIKNNGIPNFVRKKNGCMQPASISHHGRFEQIITI